MLFRCRHTGPVFRKSRNLGIDFGTKEIVNELLSEGLMRCRFRDADSVDELA